MRTPDVRLRLSDCIEVRLQTCFSSSPEKDDHLVRDLQTLTFDLTFTRKQVFKQD